MNLDDIDRKILRILQQDARISYLDLANRVNLSQTPCRRRVQRLGKAGYIRGSTVILDPDLLGINLTSYIAVTMERHTNEQFEKFESQVVKFPEVVGCSVVTGRSEDYLLKVVARNMKHYEEFLLERLSRVPGVVNLHSSFELRNVLPNKGLPVGL